MSDSQIILLLAILYICVGIWALLNKKMFKKMLEDFAENAALGYIWWLMALIIWYLIVIYHNTWEMSWTVIVTLMWWIWLMKWILLITSPGRYTSLLKKMAKNKTLPKIIWPFATFLWLFLLYVWYLIR